MCSKGEARECGAALVECTVVLPLFFFLLFAMLDSCRYVAQEAAVDDAVRQAGQFASKLVDSDCVTPARDRFMSSIRHTPFQAPVTLQVDISTLSDGTRTLQIAARADGNKLFVLGSGVHSAALYSLEYQSACSGPQHMSYPESPAPGHAQSS